MTIATLARRSALACTVVLAGAAACLPAKASQILAFGQSGTTDTVTGTETGSSTTISATNAPIVISNIAAAPATPINAFLNLSLTNTSPAVSIMFGQIAQEYSGTFAITSLAGGAGINYLSGAISDIAFGVNQAFTISASTPQNVVTFSSDLITSIYPALGVALSFTNVSPGLQIVNGTIGSFTASISGTFSGQPAPVPEPASLALLGMGMLGAGFVSRRRA